VSGSLIELKRKSRMNDSLIVPWPNCEASNPAKNCEGEVHPARWALGYRTCIKCGTSTNPVRTVAIAYNKGPIMLILSSDIKDIGK
jgi:hypothetical protein